MIAPAAIDATSKGSDARTGAAIFSLGLQWNESSRSFSVPITNKTAQEIKVIGVQATGGLYICNIPAKVPAQGSAKLTLMLYAREGSANAQEQISVLTSAGEQFIQVNHDRQQAISFDATELQWKVGEAATPKNVIITANVAGVSVTGVQAMGNGNVATVTNLGNGKFQVQVTPGDTSKKQSFPVFLAVTPRLLGVATVIRCDVFENN